MVLASRSCARKIKGLLLLLDLSKYAKITLKEDLTENPQLHFFRGKKSVIFSAYHTTVTLLYSHCITPSLPPRKPFSQLPSNLLHFCRTAIGLTHTAQNRPGAPLETCIILLYIPRT